ncbi:ABC transporter ATP-binding protein [Fodinicola acaciae]|uniref:ABC transporter ATP-binding protein n=1 Tax=Fodinicola acaciae TaxID=2681555 RepID=UPI001C9E64C0|nr:ABC transporter ATP-binding protein [Fodinicola acaciae]
MEALRLLMEQIRPHRWLVLTGAVITFVGGLAGLAEPLAAKAVIDSLGSGRSLLWPIVLLTGLVAAGAAVSALGGYVLARTAENVVLTARRRLIGRMLRLRVSDVDRLKPGDLIARLTSDTTLLRGISTTGLVNAANGVLMVIGSIVLMAVMDWVLLLVTLGVLVLIGGLAGLMLPQIGRATEAAQASVATIGTTLERALGAFRTVKASNAEAREIESGRQAAAQAWRSGVRAAKWNAAVDVVAGLAIQVSFLVVLGVGGARVATGAMELSSLIAFLLFLFYLMAPVMSVIEAGVQLQLGLAAIRRMREIELLQTESGNVLEFRPQPVAAGPASISFDRVSFRYQPDGPLVHQDLSFRLPAGGMSAFVGPSGAGKTTVFSLIERFYEPESGSVRVDGRDTADWPLNELRAAIAYVEQDAPILAGTIRDNLLYAAPTASDDEIAAAVARTRLESTISRLPDGLDTVVGHRGVTLSGGERQRIAIARALLRRPRVLLLDEITSQLDAVNELALREVVADVAKTTTVLVIAHRLSTVASADRVLVIDRGELRATGTHAELLAAGGLYRELATTQSLEAGGLAS